LRYLQNKYECMTFRERAKDIYEMIAGGKMIDAFDKYYGETVSMVDVGHGPAVVGKEANRLREIAFLDMIEDFHGMGVDSITSDESAGVTMIENWMDITLKGIGRVKYTQVAVQRWEGDYIVDEKFYHK
jgi:hypothetical protein